MKGAKMESVRGRKVIGCPMRDGGCLTMTDEDSGIWCQIAPTDRDVLLQKDGTDWCQSNDGIHE